MKRKAIILGMVVALTLVLVAPGAALAAKPADFTASGDISEVTQGEIFPAGNSGRWVVDERQMFGTMSGAVNGPFTLTYAANVELETQAGSFHGTLEVGSLLFKVRGKSELIGPSYPGPVVDTPYGSFPTNIDTLKTTGGWTLIQGAKGTGDYIGLAIVLIASAGPLEGHILGVDPMYSGFSMSGQWQP